MTNELEKLSAKDIRNVEINKATAQIIEAYLQYSGKLIESVLNKQCVSLQDFKEIDDDMVIKPYELIDLIDEVQKALRETND
jgi:hypothetical protein